jgi:hypothetical protein
MPLHNLHFPQIFSILFEPRKTKFSIIIILVDASVLTPESLVSFSYQTCSTDREAKGGST